MPLFRTYVARRVLTAATALTALGLAPLATHAQATQITSTAGLAPGDTTLTYAITDTTFVRSYTGSAGGNTLTFTDTGQSIYESRQGGDLSGNYPTGTNTLGTVSSTHGSAGPLTITFASGVTEFGLTAENAFQGSYRFTFTPFSGTTPLGSFTVGPVGEIQNAFLGAKVSSGSITGVQIASAASLLLGGKSNIFVVGPTTFATAAPEPSAWVVLGVGVLTAAGLRVYRRRA